MLTLCFSKKPKHTEALEFQNCDDFRLDEVLMLRITDWTLEVSRNSFQEIVPSSVFM